MSQDGTEACTPLNVVSRLLDIDVALMKSIEVNTLNASVGIEPHDLAQILVTAESDEPFATEALVVKAKAKSLSVYFQHRGLAGVIWKKQPGVRIKIQVPRFFSATVNSKTGEVSVTGLAGRVAVNTVTGPIRLHQVSGVLRIESNSGVIEGDCPSAAVQVASRSGKIHLYNLIGSVACRAKRGTVCLEWKTAPSEAKINIRVDHQPVSVIMPPDTKINYRFITGASAIMNEFAQVDDSNLLLRLISKRGSISMRKQPSVFAV